jgi:hypothetical protein
MKPQVQLVSQFGGDAYVSKMWKDRAHTRMLPLASPGICSLRQLWLMAGRLLSAKSVIPGHSSNVLKAEDTKCKKS